MKVISLSPSSFILAAVLLLSFLPRVLAASPSFQDLLLSAQQGNAADQYNVALIYKEGKIRNSYTGQLIRGDGIDSKKAAYFFKLSAQQGFVSSMYELGRIYGYGRADLRNARQAFEWFYLAAQGGHNDAAYEVALSYQNGTGVEKDERQAEYWMMKAAEGGNLQAMVRAGQLDEAAGAATSRIKSRFRRDWDELVRPFKRGYQKEESRDAFWRIFGD